ncbi:MBL fold metallo-hydrolase [Candidatus Bathyarchaeota archaeon]|nr:MBL fold metallo-hydrolase [Candidatus Bathyarchaeota archaeon]MBT6603892.1 MBL fold metallo-hydrolase [Candidatus Bathyarchaeota archaeon]
MSKGGTSVLIDPFDSKSGEVDGEVIYCTHCHPDHVGGIPSFMERNPDAILMTNEQVAGKFKQFSDRTVIARDEESYKHGDWEFQFIAAKHGILRDLNIGVIVRNGDETFGHVGDTITFEGFISAMVDTIAVPITGILTTSPSQAITELKKFQPHPQTVVVMHWAFRNPKSFCRRLSVELPNVKCIVPKKGELIPL